MSKIKSMSGEMHGWTGPAVAALVLLALVPAALHQSGTVAVPREGMFLAVSNPAALLSQRSSQVAVNLWHAATLTSTNR